MCFTYFLFVLLGHFCFVYFTYFFCLVRPFSSCCMFYWVVLHNFFLHSFPFLLLGYFHIFVYFSEYLSYYVVFVSLNYFHLFCFIPFLFCCMFYLDFFLSCYISFVAYFAYYVLLGRFWHLFCVFYKILYSFFCLVLFFLCCVFNWIFLSCNFCCPFYLPCVFLDHLHHLFVYFTEFLYCFIIFLLRILQIFCHNVFLVLHLLLNRNKSLVANKICNKLRIKLCKTY